MYNHEKHKDSISYYTDVISAPEKLVEFINELDQYEKAYPSISKWKDNIKNFSIPVTTGDSAIDRKVLYIYNSIFSAMWFCARLYAESRKIEYPEDRLQKTFSLYRDIDTLKENNVSFNIDIYLNDNYEGGDVHFVNQEFMVKPEAGSLIIYPSDESYQYQVSPILSGTRYKVPGYWLK